MAKANYVGRVGALAVALGIGAAVVTAPGVVWAQPDSDTSSSGNADRSSENTTDKRSAESPKPEKSDGEDAKKPDTEDPDTEDPDEDEPVGEDDENIDENIDEDVDEEPAKPRKRASRDSQPDQTHEQPTGSSGADDGTEADDSVPVTESDLPEAAPDEQQSPVLGDVERDVAISVPADDTETEPRGEESAATPINVLQTVFAPNSSTGSPEGPAESPLLWAVLAYARRQFDPEKATIGKTASPAGLTELVEDTDNSAPVPAEVTTSGPGFLTGSVSGRVTATDPDGDRLTFTGSTVTDSGRVTVYSSGRFSYTPTAAARHAAAADDATDEQKINTFTVTITDSAGNVATTNVSVDISPANMVPISARARARAGNLSTGSVIVTVDAFDFDGDTLTFTGPAPTDKGVVVDNGDGTFTYTPTAAAREAAAAPGAPASAGIDTLVFTVSDGHGGMRTTTIDVDVTPAVEASASTPGKSAGPVIVSANGTIYQVTYDVDPTTMSPIRTRVSILDENGQVLRTTDDIAGSPREQAPAVARADGSLVLVTYRESTNTSTVSTVDGFGTVKTIGTVIGQPSFPMQVAPNGAVFLQTRRFSQSGDRLVRISETDSLRVFQVGRVGGPLTVAPDGSAYIVGASPLFGNPLLLAVGRDGNSRRVSLPGTSAPDNVVIGPDGRGYLAVARNFFGTTTTRVYTMDGTSSTVRQIPGSPVTGAVAAAEGVYQATYDEATGTTYISRITADTIETSDPIDGRVWNQISVTPDGTVYVPLRDPATQVFSVAVVSSDGDVITIAIPGVLPGVPPGGSQTGNPNSGESGYVAYTDGGITYLAVLNADGTFERKVPLPGGGTVGNPVSFAPNGVAYQVIQFKDAQGRVTSQAVLTLTNDAVTPVLSGGPLRPNFPDLQYGPDGTAYLVTVESATFAHHILGFDQNGATVVTLDVTGPLVPQQSDYVFDQSALAFGADGTAYVTVRGADAGVWALTPGGGASQVLDLELGPADTIEPVSFGRDGTPYVTVTERVGTGYVTTVHTVTPSSVL
ncbi:Ig-like domain-containing protein [Mycolicibacterium hippocampi]|uniref:Ig-like domain-containing protein n=1 Tax=Mycolicibacterium hippocampi TaxID=659824 RepID=UPI003511DFB6